MSTTLKDGIVYVKAKNVVIRVGTSFAAAAGKPPLSVSKGGTFNFQIDTSGNVYRTDGLLTGSDTTSILEDGLV